MAEDLPQGKKLGFRDDGLGGGREAACGTPSPLKMGLGVSQGSECSHLSEVAHFAAGVPELWLQSLLSLWGAVGRV